MNVDDKMTAWFLLNGSTILNKDIISLIKTYAMV